MTWHKLSDWSDLATGFGGAYAASYRSIVAKDQPSSRSRPFGQSPKLDTVIDLVTELRGFHSIQLTGICIRYELLHVTRLGS